MRACRLASAYRSLAWEARLLLRNSKLPLLGELLLRRATLTPLTEFAQTRKPGFYQLGRGHLAEACQVLEQGALDRACCCGRVAVRPAEGFLENLVDHAERFGPLR